MQNRITKIAALLAGLFVLSLFAVWLALSSSMLAKMRGDLTARFLTAKLGQVIEITDGVVVGLGSTLHVVAKGLVVPSQTMADVTLAEIRQLQFNVALRDLLRGRVNPSDLQVDGARVELLVDRDATSSWSTAKAKPSPDAGQAPSTGENGNIADLLAGQEIRFLRSGVTYRDARNGLDLDLLLPSLELGQKDRSAPVTLQGAGTLNGQELSLNATFPQAQPFKVTAAFSQIGIVLDGTPDQGGFDAGFSTAISVDIADLGQLLDVLKLEKSLSGTGQVNADFQISGGSASVSDLDINLTLDGGQSLRVTGDLGKLDDPYDVSVDTDIRLYPETAMPPPTESRRDLKLTGIVMQLIARPGDEPLRRMIIETNGFVLDTGGEGLPPISFSQISRTPDGLLRVGRLVVRIGPPDAPFLILDGAVEDALRLEGIDVQGTLALPTTNLLAPELFQASDVLGRITGGFRLRGNAEELGLSDLNAVSEGTDLWNLRVSGSVKNALDFDDVALDIAADIPSGATLLAALDLEPVETGPVKLTTKVSSQGTKWMSDATVSAAQSQLNVGLDIDFAEPNPIVRGQIESDLIRVEHVRDIVAAALQLARLDDLEKAASQQVTPESEDAKSTGPSTPAASLTDSADGKITEPLVLAKPAQTEPATSRNSDGRVPAEPGTTQPPGPFRNVTLKPLGRAILLSGLDLGVAIDIRRIEGERGISSLKSDLEMKDQKARLGPVKFEYGGGYFDISGSLDLIENPETLKLSGSTGGWNFGTIMQDLQFKKGASGVLSASFDVSGSHASVRDFLATVSGGATVSMRQGSIDSQLLDLAGLGVLPWLFSKERGATATIVCVRAPLRISRGRISTERTVVETDRVQIVVLGNVDLKNKTLDIVGQPRRIGKPLSRSPWPFTAVGPIGDPKIKVKDGPRRLRRSDGASTMPQRRKLCVPDILQLK